MRTNNLLRVATLSLALGFAGVVGATSAFAQDQYQRYDYARDVAPYLPTQQAQVQDQANLAQGPSAIRSDASQALFPSNAPVSTYNPEAVLNQEGGNAW